MILVLSGGCQMWNPAFNTDGAAAETSDDTLETTAESDDDTLDSDDADTTTGTGDTTGTSDTSTGTSDTSTGTDDSETMGAICGDGVVDANEECDGNAVPNGDCSPSCEISCFEFFGNCNLEPADGCEASFESDPKHCGSCDHDCLDGQCSFGYCEGFLLSEGETPYDVALANEIVYWIDRPAGTLHAQPLAGGEPQTWQGLAQPLQLALGGSAIWVSEWAGNRVTGVAYDFDASTTFEGQVGPSAITTGDGRVYWGLYDSGAGFFTEENGDGPIVDFLDVQPQLRSFAYADGALAWGTTYAFGVSWIDQNVNEELGEALLNQVTTDGQYLYFTTVNSVHKVSLDGGGALVTLATNQGSPDGLAVANGWLYWGNNATGEIMSLFLQQGEPEPIAEGQYGVKAVDASANHVVWAIASEGGGVWAITL